MHLSTSDLMCKYSSWDFSLSPSSCFLPIRITIILLSVIWNTWSTHNQEKLWRNQLQLLYLLFRLASQNNSKTGQEVLVEPLGGVRVGLLLLHLSRSYTHMIKLALRHEISVDKLNLTRERRMNAWVDRPKMRVGFTEIRQNLEVP